jgi:hypothetical protein
VNIASWGDGKHGLEAIYSHLQSEINHDPSVNGQGSIESDEYHELSEMRNRICEFDFERFL